MNQLTAAGLILAVVFAATFIAELYIDKYFDWSDRRRYRRKTDPRNIEKNSQDLLEKELQEFLLEYEMEKRKNHEASLRNELDRRARQKMNHPSNWKKQNTLNNETREILAKLTNPREEDGPRRDRKDFFPHRHDRNEDYWGGE